MYYCESIKPIWQSKDNILLLSTSREIFRSVANEHDAVTGGFDQYDVQQLRN
jgi:hypothetical protein